MSYCKSCGAEIIWVRTGNGKAMPVDAEPSAAGSLVLEQDPQGRTAAHVAGLFDGSDQPRYVSHFVTCPDADLHRRSR